MALPFVIREVLPVGLTGLVVAGVCSIVMSSADSFLNSAAIAFVNDLVTPMRRRPLERKQALFLAKLTTLFVGLAAIVFAVRIKSILDILIYAYNFWSPVILVPLVSAMSGLSASRRASVAGASAGVAGVALWNSALRNPGSVDGLVVGVLCNLVVFTAVHHVEKRTGEIRR